jgi:queuine tRNA-ribosyltransferase
MNHFKVLKTQGYARLANLHLSHGTVETPVFMPVGTYGVVKTQTPNELKNLGTQILLGNTYHLYLRPGLELLESFGGLHSFMNWDGPILTDSGGFQVFSLGALRKMSDEGVLFRSPLNGNEIFLTPELSAKIQQVIGSDIAMVLDECLSLPATEKDIENAVKRSAAWAKRFFDVARIPGQKIYGILQGGTSLDFRKLSLDLTLPLPLDGLAVGGLSVGEPHKEMVHVLEGLAPLLPKELPHYLMGVGTPRDILEAVRCGIDQFDCVLPTRNARNGGFFTSSGLLNIRNSEYKLDKRPIDENCKCECCTSYSRAYLRHLFQVKEILGCRLATTHNLYYYHHFLKEIRDSLRSDRFEAFYQERIPILTQAYPDKLERSLAGADKEQT